MNDEEAFQAALDLRVDDFTTRLVFADWLEERGDPRAAGYRVMGEMWIVPWLWQGKWYWVMTETGRSSAARLRKRWHTRLTLPGSRWGYSTRREAEDDAALAYSKLPTGSYV